MIRHSRVALVLALVGCTAPVSPVGGPGAGDGGLADGSVVLIFDAGPPLYDFTPFFDGGTFSIGGQPVATIYWDGGVKTIVFPGSVDPLLTILYPDRNHISVTGDQNQDGVIDYQFSSVLNGATLTENEQWDRTFGGVFDDMSQRILSPGDAGYPILSETETQLIDADGGYALPDAGGSWVVTATYQGPAFQGQETDGEPDAGCAGFAGEPTNPPQAVPAPGHPGVAVPINVTGACPAASAQSIAIAAQVSLDQLYSCLNAHEDLDAFNFLAWAKLLTAESMLAESQTHLYIFCNDTCDNTLAATLTYGCWSQGPIPGLSTGMNLRSATVNPPSFTFTDDQLTETITHELLHFSGYTHNPYPAGTPAGHDLVYSCGRYCNSCRSCLTFGGSNTPQSFHQDCATCADDAHRYLCGVTASSDILGSCGTHAQGCKPACDLCGIAVYRDCNNEIDTKINNGENANGGQYCCEDSSCGNNFIPPCDGLSYVGAYDGCSKFPVGICTTGPATACYTPN